MAFVTIHEFYYIADRHCQPSKIGHNNSIGVQENLYRLLKRYFRGPAALNDAQPKVLKQDQNHA